MELFPIINFVVGGTLALPVALRERSVPRFFIAFVLVALGILIPMWVFFLSAFLTPEWKGGARFGWVDCFHVGKFALYPLVLWACAAFYVAQVLRPPRPVRPWVVLGLLTGAVTAFLCFVFGLVVVPFEEVAIPVFLVVPLYVATWHFELYRRARKHVEISRRAHAVTLMGSVPFWLAGVSWSLRHFDGLPDARPGCFVVTAAMRGHEAWVGPLFPVERDGQRRIANGQLATFWRFEETWQGRHPASHRIFRGLYNRIGPWVARRIRSRWAADGVHLLLKPAELLAACAVRMSGGPKTGSATWSP